MAQWRQLHTDPDVFSIEVPLPHNALRTVNSYLVRDGGDALLIDTGFDNDECHRVLTDALDELRVAPGQFDLFVTHEHTDHFGLMERLAPRRALLSCTTLRHIEEAASKEWIETQVQTLLEEGFDEASTRRIVGVAPTISSFDGRLENTQCVGEEDEIVVGRFAFSPIHTPGHAQGHLCLYLPERELVFTGDHILFDISPNIAHWSASDDPLADYLNSLNKVRELPVSTALPGHRSPRASIADRIDGLRLHHEARLEDCLDACSRDEGRLAIDVASRMSWAKDAHFADLGLAQQLFAAGEARAHLEHLVRKGEAVREIVDEQIFYVRL